MDDLKAQSKKSTGFTHEKIETNNFLMIVLILLVLAVGGLVEIVPLFFQKSTTQPVEGLKPINIHSLDVAASATPNNGVLSINRNFFSCPPNSG